MSKSMSKPNTLLLLKFETPEDREYFIGELSDGIMEDYVSIEIQEHRYPLTYKVTTHIEDEYEEQMKHDYADHQR